MQHSALNKCDHESPSLNLILMFKTYAANEPSIYYITQTNVNEAGWPFETGKSSSVSDSATCCRLGQKC